MCTHAHKIYLAFAVRRHMLPFIRTSFVGHALSTPSTKRNLVIFLCTVLGGVSYVGTLVSCHTFVHMVIIRNTGSCFPSDGGPAIKYVHNICINLNKEEYSICST